jgi:hypothetical protein
MAQITPLEFADKIGRATIARAMNVGLTAVSNAVVRGQFPASWFVTCQVLAANLDLQCPPDLFGQKGDPSSLGAPLRTSTADDSLPADQDGNVT